MWRDPAECESQPFSLQPYRDRQLSDFSMCDVAIEPSRAPLSEDVPRLSFIVAEPKAFF